MKPRVAVVTSHPVQYNAPLFREITRRGRIDLTVLYESVLGTGLEDMHVEAFGRSLAWDVDLLEGYEHRFLSRARKVTPQRRRGMLDPSVVDALRRGRFDVAVIFGWAHATEIIAMVAARLLRIPYLLYTDTDARDPGTSGRPELRRLVLSAIVRAAAGALYTGTFNRDLYLRFGTPPQRLFFSPWSVERERFGGGDRHATRARLGLREEVVYSLFVGTLIERKRPLDLLDAVARLQQAGAPAGALMVGTGPLEDAVRRRCAELADVHFLGFAGQSELPDVYAAADVFVLPTSHDPRATVVNEAMAAGLPVVITDGTGVWGPGDLVADGREGLVVPVGDAGALAHAIERLVDAECRARMGAAARARLDTWNYEVAAEGWERAVQSLVA